MDLLLRNYYLKEGGVVHNECYCGYPCSSRCPEYQEPFSNHYCSICGDGIVNGEEYVINQDNKYAHYECLSADKQTLEWCGCEVKEMEAKYEN